MSRLDELIQELCPGGVRHVALASPEIATFTTGKQLNRSDLIPDGEYEVFNGGVSSSGRHTDWNTSGPSIIVSQGGASAGFVNFVADKFWAGAHCYVVSPGPAIDRRFLYFALKSKEPVIRAAAQGAGIPGLSRGALGGIVVPVPPIDVQQEIVQVLDHFTRLEAELEAELEARQIQFSHYRDELVGGTDCGDVQWMTIGDLYTSSSGLSKSADQFGYGYPFLPFTTVFNFATVPAELPSLVNTTEAERERYSIRAGDVFVTRTSEDLDGLGMSCAALADYPNATFNGFTKRLRPRAHDNVLAKFSAYFFRSRVFRAQIAQMAIKSTRVSLNDNIILRVRIPVPPLREQKRIVHILDGLDALVNDPNVGLVAELSARRKQYEYYRDRLLSFKELVA